MRTVFTNGKIFTGSEWLDDKSLWVEDGKIHSIADTANWESAQQIDLKGNMLAPAFMDIQVYGGNGMLYSEFPSVQSVRATYDSCLGGGATHILPTISTNTMDLMLEGIQAVKDYWKQGGTKGVMGVHLEGPWLNLAKKGAHKAECIHSPAKEEVKTLLAAGEGVIKLITLAPEVCDDSIISMLLEAGIRISAGHSNASYEEGMKAFSRISLATHLFNAMSALQHRAPGMVGAIFDHPGVSASVVADGHHVDFSVIRISKNLMKERLFLITDAVAESFKGHYQHRLDGDKYVLPDGTLSGSNLTMMKAVRNCVEKIGIPLDEALRMGSLYPAMAMGMENSYGKLQAGYVADLVDVRNDLSLESVYVEGNLT